MAFAKCSRSIKNMEFMTPDPPECVAEAKEEIMSGVLRNGRGTKVIISFTQFNQGSILISTYISKQSYSVH